MKMSEVKIKGVAGCFDTAIKLLQEDMEGTSDLELRIEKRKYLSRLEMRKSEFQTVSIGQAMFPAVNDTNGNGGIFKFEVSAEDHFKTPEFLINDFNLVKELVSLTLDDFLRKKIKKCVIFDWGMEKLQIRFSNPLFNELQDSGDDGNTIIGSSYKLAMAIALVSQILQINLGEGLVFSGDLETKSGEVTIMPVTLVPEKIHFIKKELPKYFRIIILSESPDDRLYLYDCKKLDELIITLLEGKEKEIEEKLKNFKTEKIYYDIMKVSGIDGDIYSYCLFRHETVSINKKNLLKLFSYFENIKDNLILNSTGGLIISGMKLNIAAQGLVSMLSNKVKGLLAVRHFGFDFNELELPDGEKEKLGLAVVVQDFSSPKKKKGEMIFYSRPEIELT